MSDNDRIAELMVKMYQHKFIQTIWNAEKPINRQEGWYLKSGLWSPWFFNMRPIGCAPEIYNRIIIYMHELTSSFNIDTFIGVDMAGITFVGALANEHTWRTNRYYKIGYTRPLNPKPSTPKDAADLMEKFEKQEQKNMIAGMSYGQKEYVEARFSDGDRVAIFDDMSTNLGSKIIARLLTLHAAKQQGKQITCNDIFYFLNRGKTNRQAGIDFAENPDARLFPARLNVQYAVEFDNELPVLESVMTTDEYRLIRSYQESAKDYQSKEAIQDALKLAS